MVGVLAARGASARLFEILEREEKIPLSGGVRPEGLKGDVAFEGVTFSYPSRSDIKVLKDYTLQVPANSTAALVGSSGSGKSTVIALLERFYDAEGGQILIDGVDIKDLDPSWLHDNIALVLQEVSHWSNTDICFHRSHDHHHHRHHYHHLLVTTSPPLHLTSRCYSACR